MATYGGSNAPGSNTINYDAIMTTSLFNYQRTLTDQISKSNAFFYKIQENGMYEGVDGGVAMQVPLMYALGNADWYDGYDVLSTDPMDGLSMATFDWRQMSVPCTISRKEERQNTGGERIIDLLKTKIMQAEMGIKQRFNQALLQGSFAGSGTSLTTNDASGVNGALGIEPLPALVSSTPTTSTTIGGINQSTSTWWQNSAVQSALTSGNKSTDFLFEADKLYNLAARGPGGPPDLILVDQYTYQVWNAAMYQAYRRDAASDNNFPFDNIKFHKAIVVWDEFVPDVMNGTTTPLTGVGTALFLNTKFLGVKYDKETNFVSTPFMKPVNQDAKVAHILWMGNVVVSNRRKQAVWFNLPRTLTWVM